MEIRNSNYLEKFSDITLLVQGNLEIGEPTIFQVFDSDDYKLVKFWKKDTHNSSELEQLWLREIRQLQRLKGFPDPDRLIAHIVESSQDNDGYYLVLDSGGRLPISFSKNKWIKSLTKLNDNNRTRFWINIKRIIKAIDFLHAQGLFHRKLSKDSILLGDDSTNENFQLTGFEWSIRIQNINNNLFEDHFLNDEETFSFSNDWRDFGRVICSLLDVTEEEVNNLTIHPHFLLEKTGLTLRELTCIRAMLGITRLEANLPFQAMNGNNLIEYINQHIMPYAEQHAPYDIVFQLKKSRNNSSENANNLNKELSELTDLIQSIDPSIEDSDAAFEFIKNDISENFSVIFYLHYGTPTLLLQGNKIKYLIEPYYSNGTRTWDIAACKLGFLELPFVAKENKYKSLSINQVKIINKRNAGWIPSNTNWQPIIDELNSDKTYKTSQQRSLIDGFLIYHLLEAAYAQTDIYPVEIYDKTDDIIKLSCSNHSELIEKRELLKNDSQEECLINLLEDGEIDWILTNRDNFQDDENNIHLKFLELKQENGKNFFFFETNQELLLNQNFLFLVPQSVSGTLRQLDRRAAALELLDQHIPLIDLLISPHSSLEEAPEKYQIRDIDVLLADLEIPKTDESKKIALANILNLLPLHLVQGPPGVGKTFLVTTLVKYIFQQSNESKVLLTAQSHDTVEHLYQKVLSSIKQNSDSQLLIVKCIKSSNTNNPEDTVAVLDELALSYLKDVNTSPIIKMLPLNIRTNVLKLSNTSEYSQRHTLRTGLLRAANIVFTTTNSRYVEDMIKDKVQFDWSIMEETGKVTGIELISPLLLSYRRLMIGDHLQLPPYRSNEIQEVLGNHVKLPKIIHGVLESGQNLFKGGLLSRRIHKFKKIEQTDELEWRKLGGIAKQGQLLFKELVDKEEDKIKTSKISGKIHKKILVSMLNEQYRMHPEIAEIVSKVFYNPAKDRSLNKLKTYVETEDFYKCTAPPFKWSDDSILVSSTPVTWITIPDLRNNKGSQKYADMPNWKNEYEKNVILEVLAGLKPNSSDGKPTLAILTGYQQQVQIINSAIEANINDSLINLKDFEPADSRKDFCRTIDSFQGSEADLIVISMVRNNIKGKVRKAFGFILDIQRFNVLLSRAKFQMVIIGSYEFFKYWSEQDEIKQDIKLNFLTDLVNELEKASTTRFINHIEVEK